MPTQTQNTCPTITFDREWLDNQLFLTLSQDRVSHELGTDKTGFFIEHLDWFSHVNSMLPKIKQYNNDETQKELAKSLAQFLYQKGEHSWVKFSFSEYYFGLEVNKIIRVIEAEKPELANQIRIAVNDEKTGDLFRRQVAKQMGVLHGDLNPTNAD